MRAIAVLSLLSIVGIGADPVGVCPSTNGAYVDFLIDDKDCTKFYKCDWGKPVLYTCPSNLHFNSKLNVCDWPENAGCDGSNGSSEPGETTTTTKPSTQTPPSITENGGSCASVTCPYTPGEFPVFHAHPEDCGRYCKCDNYGTVHDMPCPDGLHFNTELNVCDWPENAGCGKPSNPGPGETTTTPTEPTTTTTPITKPTTTTEPEPNIPTTTPIPHNGGKCDSVTCPYTPGEYPVFHAHPEDCGRYCKCDNYGTVHDMPCPAGLHFNTELNVCDWPENAGCGKPSNPGPGETTTTPTEPTTTTTPITKPTTTTEPEPNIPTTTPIPHNGGKCDSVTCPYTPGEYPVFHAHPEDCGRYCKCDNYGTVHDMPCPAGLHFNTELNVCDWPENAGCGKPSNPGPGETTTIPTEPTTTTTPITKPTTTTEPEPNIPTTTPIPHNGGKCDSVTCPYTPGEYPVFHAHPEDCGRYCKCDNYGTVHDMPCPAGLHFNTELNVCDWPENAGCGKPSNPGPGETTTTPTEPTTTTTPITKPTTTTEPEPNIPTTTPIPHNGGKCDSVTCPYTPGDYPVFHAHPEDCGRYCKCDNYGTVHDMPCPDGLHFNTELNVCDWPENAGCGKPSNPGPGETTTTPTEPTTTPVTTPTTTTESEPITPTTTPIPHDGGKCDSVTCPYTPGDYPVFHAHPEDCGRYCKCDNYGTVHDMPCPDGLHFNTELNVCDWPSDAGCDGSNPGPSSVTTTSTEPTSTTTEQQNPAPGNDCSSVVCPAENGIYPVFHSHPKVCDRYCKCDWGVAFDMPCPDGLHFNPVLNVCDYPVDAGCPHA